MDNNDEKKMKSKFGCLKFQKMKKEIRIERNCLLYDLFHTKELNLVPYLSNYLSIFISFLLFTYFSSLSFLYLNVVIIMGDKI